MSFDIFSRFFLKNKKDANEDVKIAPPTDLPASIAAAKAAIKAPSLFLKVSFATDKGRVRKTNQDNFYIDGKYKHRYGKTEHESYIELTQEPHIYGVFDGMGGEAHGETASALAALELEKFSEQLKQTSISDLPFYMNEFTRTANAAIRDMLADRDSERGGSTFTALYIKNNTAYPFYLGDSRIYLFEDGELFQLTEDQTLAVRKVKAGVYTEEFAQISPDSHKLTCFLGADTADIGLDAQPCMPIPLKAGTKLIMCSDGLYDMCTKEEIASILSSENDNPSLKLIHSALKNGGKDNVTCVVVEAIELL